MESPLTSFQRLCERARRLGGQIELTVESGRPLGPKGAEYRMLERIRVRNGDQVIAERRITGSRVNDAAERLLEAI